jgi:PAS domain S-box-containing protein
MEEINRTSSPAPSDVAERAAAGFAGELDRAHRHTDRLFAWLMLAQWLAGIAVALLISPRTWIGVDSEIHSHVWAAVFLGGGVAALPVYLALRHSGRPLTRHTIAVAQMLVSALLIHLTGGRIETHFHVFGSLAFLAFYRDWRVLVTSTVVVALDHMVRGLYWPQSVFGVLAPSSWRWVEHAGWVLFEVAFLSVFISQSRAQMRESAERRAHLEVLNKEIEIRIAERTAELSAAHRELQRSEKYLRAIFETEPECVKLLDQNGNLLDINPAGLAMIGAADLSEVLGRCVFDFIEPGDREPFRALNDAVFRGESVTGSYELLSLDGTRRSMETHACPLRSDTGEIIAQIAVTRDVTERRQAQEELEKAQVELVTASRRAGMAEVVTSVLHNVGNVLNSVNVSCSIISSSVRKSRSDAVERVAALLRENARDLPGFFAAGAPGSQLPDYLDKLARGIA